MRQILPLLYVTMLLVEFVLGKRLWRIFFEARMRDARDAYRKPASAV